METLHPGVYVQEVSSGSRPIEGVSTSTAAFIGAAERGDLGRALMVTSFTEFQAQYGGFLKHSWLAQSALQFFANGGRRLYVVRVARGAETASIGLADRKTTSPSKTLTVAASSPGKWGNSLVLDVADGTQDADDEFKLTVKIERSTSPLVTDTLETYDNLSMNPNAFNFVKKVVNSRSKFIRVEVEPNASAEAGFSRSGANPATTLPAANHRLVVNVNGDGPQAIKLEDPLTDGAQVAAAIAKAVQGLPRLRESTPPDAFAKFKAEYDATKNVYTLTSGAPGILSSVEVADAPAENAAALLRLGRARGVEQTGGAVLRPAKGADYFVGDATVGGSVISVTAGKDGDTPQDSDYIKGFDLLDPVRDVSLIAVPGAGSGNVVGKGAAYCESRGDCFFIGDTNVSDDVAAVKAFVANLNPKNSYAAVYYPWLRAVDPSGSSSELVPMPPSGYVAGVYARTDTRRGVWKAPAGVDAALGGAVGLLHDTSDAEQDTLNPIGANVIRSFPAAGIVVWGARTLATTSNPEYRYVPVRRMAIFLERSIYDGIQWAVFEPNDESLWSSLRLSINAFMLRQFHAGAFQGRTAADAFFVYCDSTTTTQADIDAGVVNILVGFAALKPAEFVVLRLTQKTGQAPA